MTTQERLAMMNRTITVENAQKEAERLQKEAKQKQLMAQIISMGDRIRALIEVGNNCAQKGMMPRASIYHDHRVKDTFCTDGIHHEVGFHHEGAWYTNDNKFSIRYVGFDCGGACGPYDFYTDGTEVFEKYEDALSKDWEMCHRYDTKLRQPTIEHMQKFLRDFDAFEEMFYAWFDKRFGKEV